MFAIVRTGGKQYRVEEGLTLKVEKLPASVGDAIELEDVLLVSGDDGIVTAGQDARRATVRATVTGQGKGPQVVALKYRPRKGYHRKQGHRQLFTELRIDGIELEGAGAKKKGGAKAGEKPAAPEAQ